MWDKLRKDFPDEFFPRITSNVEASRANWKTCGKLDYWFTYNKQPLVDTGLFQNQKIILPNGEISELTYSQSCDRRVITMDETQHPFST